jgi:poly-beta-1,6-N-acetyl-D-glucosamine synthase
MEPVIRGQGYRVQYVPTAIVYNKGPETIADFLNQRRHVYAGHLTLHDAIGYEVSNMRAGKILPTLLHNLNLRPRPFCSTWAVLASRLTAACLW